MSDSAGRTDTIELAEIIKILRPWWALVVFVPVVVSLLVYFALSLQPTNYLVSATIPLNLAPSAAVLQPVLKDAQNAGLQFTLADGGRSATISGTGTSPDVTRDHARQLITSISQTPALDKAARELATSRANQLNADIAALRAALSNLESAPPATSATAEYNPAVYAQALVALLHEIRTSEDRQLALVAASPGVLTDLADFPITTEPIKQPRLPMALFAGGVSLVLALLLIVGVGRRRQKGL